jgi:hypothetical protein
MDTSWFSVTSVTTHPKGTIVVKKKAFNPKRSYPHKLYDARLFFDANNNGRFDVGDNVVTLKRIARTKNNTIHEATGGKVTRKVLDTFYSTEQNQISKLFAQARSERQTVRTKMRPKVKKGTCIPEGRGYWSGTFSSPLSWNTVRNWGKYAYPQILTKKKINPAFCYRAFGFMEAVFRGAKRRILLAMDNLAGPGRDLDALDSDSSTIKSLFNVKNSEKLVDMSVKIGGIWVYHLDLK